MITYINYDQTSGIFCNEFHRLRRGTSHSQFLSRHGSPLSTPLRMNVKFKSNFVFICSYVHILQQSWCVSEIHIRLYARIHLYMYYVYDDQFPLIYN